MNSKTNITTLTSLLLDYLEINYSQRFLNRKIEELPYNGSMWAIKTMLKMYGVDSKGLMVDKTEVINIPTPFIAATIDKFILVTYLNNDYIKYISSTKKEEEHKLLDFLQIYTGKILLPQKRNLNKEYNSQKHQKEDVNALINLFVGSASLIISIIAFFVWILVSQSQYVWWNIVNMVGFIIGMLLSIVLLQEQSLQENAITHKLCGSIKGGNCKNVLNSNAAKILGGYSWSEIGCTYFLTAIILSMFMPQIRETLAFISVCTLPYPVWSILYQKYKVKNWCIFCIFVQIDIIFLAALNLIVGNFQCNFYHFILFGIVFITLLSFINWGCRLKNKAYEARQWEKVYKQLKYSNDIFETLSKDTDSIQADPSLETSLVFGNKEAACQITVFGNLHCVSCAKLHQALQWVNKEESCIHYYFTTITAEYEQTAKEVIACYQQYGEKETEVCLNSWYDKVASGLSSDFTKFSLDLNRNRVQSEIEIHKKWMEKFNLLQTPVIFINGKKLPWYYTFEDLIFLLPK